MFNWLTNLFKPKVQTLTLAEAEAIPKALVNNYPRDQYKAYYESILTQEKNGNWIAEVRFIGYQEDIRHNHTIVSDSRIGVEKLVDKLINERMEQYRK